MVVFVAIYPIYILKVKHLFRVEGLACVIIKFKFLIEDYTNVTSIFAYLYNIFLEIYQDIYAIKYESYH